MYSYIISTQVGFTDRPWPVEVSALAADECIAQHVLVLGDRYVVANTENTEELQVDVVLKGQNNLVAFRVSEP